MEINLARQSSCDSCNNIVYYEESEGYTCEVELDEEEMVRFLQDSYYDCPYYVLVDEYAVVRHQM